MGLVVVMAVAVEVEHPSPVSVPAAADGLTYSLLKACERSWRRVVQHDAAQP
jgi:hypothetical protein